MPAREPDLLTKPEAAEKLRVSPSTLDRLRAQGEVAWVPVGRQVRFRPEALAEYVERVERRAASDRGTRAALFSELAFRGDLAGATPG